MSVDPIQRLVLELARLPTIGERSATRLAFYLLKDARRGRPCLANDIAAALNDVVEQVGLCPCCQNFCAKQRCKICDDAKRRTDLMCVVETVADLRAIEQSGTFDGMYHVLHGSLAPLDGIGPQDLKLDDVVERVKQLQCNEVILATNTDVEGDATALYLSHLLCKTSAQVTRLASGVPMGGGLEYLDPATLGRAISERRSFVQQ